MWRECNCLSALLSSFLLYPGYSPYLLTTHYIHGSLSSSRKKYVDVLENSIEWVVPPGGGRKCAYAICPFPCGGNDEDNLSIDKEIPIVVDDLDEFDFKLPKKTDPNAIEIDTISTVIEKWSNTGPKVLRAQRTEALALYGTTSDLLRQYTHCFDGGARTTLNINELQDVLHMLSTVAKDGCVLIYLPRLPSPLPSLFAYVRRTLHSCLPQARFESNLSSPTERNRGVAACRSTARRFSEEHCREARGLYLCLPREAEGLCRCREAEGLCLLFQGGCIYSSGRSGASSHLSG